MTTQTQLTMMRTDATKAKCRRCGKRFRPQRQRAMFQGYEMTFSTISCQECIDRANTSEQVGR
jgi:late competence protein required for DNA uptake (superfamily II DNA/RNA helicase)